MPRKTAVVARRMPQDGPEAPISTREPCGAVERASTGNLLDHWELWFPARLGPPRKRTKTVNGVKVTAKVRRPELPPSPNDRLHPQARAKLVKDWRDAARDTARERDLPRLERARVSVVVYRRALGVADPDNDIGRIKPLLDGLRDAGALSGDTYGSVTIGTVEERTGDHGIVLIADELA